MARLTLAEKLERAARKKARIEQEEARLKTAARKARTRELIELGGLFAKAGIDKLPRAALYACCMRIAEEAKDPATVAGWEQDGRGHFQAEDDARVVAVAKFPEKVSAETAAKLRALGFRWNKLLEQWEGRVNFELASTIISLSGGQFDKL